MSFSTDIKDELCRHQSDPCCKRAELAGLLLVLGSIQVSEGQANIILQTENAMVARHIFQLVKNQYGISSTIAVKQKQQLKKRQTYRITIPQAMSLLTDLSIFENGYIRHHISSTLIKKTCCKKAFVRAAFWGCGSMSDPEKGYHLEFVIHNKEYTDSLLRVLRHFNIKPNTVERKGAYVVYLKESDRIADVLTMMGAYTCVLALENIRIVKEMRNQVNRGVNCESHNLDKVVEAARKQYYAIESLRKAGVLEQLPEQLQEVAALRIENPECALAELGDMLTPPLGKSGMNHRMRRLMEAAKQVESVY